MEMRLQPMVLDVLPNLLSKVVANVCFKWKRNKTGGGGSKEMALRAQDKFQKGDVQLNVLQEHFLTIGMAKVSTSRSS